MDENVLMSLPGVGSRILKSFKKLSVRSRKQSVLPPLPAFIEETASWFPKGRLCHRFLIGEIRLATEDFNERLLIGRGGFGNIYKGTLVNGAVVVIKRLSSYSSEGAQEFETEVDILPILQHRNIVCLIGYCNDGKEVILVYEYMSNGTLYDHLHQHHTPLSWSQRLTICIDVARALDYLHTGTRSKGIIHRAVKSSNIMLDDRWTAKIKDFAWSIIIPMDSVSTDLSTRVVGTVGYLDPAYLKTGIATKKIDVYSFGVVLLEVLCRRRAVDKSHDWERPVLTVWAKDCLEEGKIEQIIDPDLRGQVSLKCLNDYAKIVESCLHEHQELRITMVEVVVGLESILALHERTELESILALHERTDYSIPQMGITTSDTKYFLSSGQNSAQAPSGSNTIPPPGGNYSLKGIDRLSVKSHQPKGDQGRMSDSLSEMDIISEESYQLRERNSTTEQNFEDIDEKLVSRNQTKSLYDRMQLDFIQRADILTRMDFLHLIWFYPMEKEAEINFGSLVDKVSSLSKYLRNPMESSRDGDYVMEIQTLLQDVEEHLDAAAFDMDAYLPEFRSPTVWSDIPKIHASTIASATSHALRCIKDLKVKMLGISGSGAEEVAETLYELPELKIVFDMVLFVRVIHYSIENFMHDIKEEMELWKKRRSETGNKINSLDQLPNCLLYLDCSDELLHLHEIEFHLSRWFQTVQIMMTSGSQIAYREVDLEIRVQDHFLPWNLFSKNVDLTTVGKNSSILQMATRLVEKCHGHLLAIILLARALRGVVDVGVWELALQELEEPSSSLLGVTSDVMVKILRFILSRMETMSQKCIIHFALHYRGANFEKSSLIYSWITDGLVKSEQEGEYAFDELIRSFLLEEIGGKFVRMRDETRVTLVVHFVPREYGLYLKKYGSESNEMPNVEEWNAREIYLSNNILSELPDNPICPILIDLFLHSNQDLMGIPITFFDNMPSLQVLDFSNTSIKCLPSSISKLTTLRKLFLRHCDLMMELPPEIGALKNLKVFDSEGTQLICLPEQFGSLTKLECLKFSLYSCAHRYNGNKQSMQIVVPDLSKFLRLKELSIFVDSYGEWWEDEVKHIINHLSSVWKLESLRLYFPNTELLHIFMEKQSWKGIPIYPYLSNFSFIIGHIEQRLISRLPLNLDETFIKLPKCLKYTNGEGDTDTNIISSALKHANAFFLDRHWSIQSLSTFELAEMVKLKFILLAECNEMLEIVNGSCLEDSSPVLGSLEYLSINYMKSLSCIWKGPIYSWCLSNLKTLTMHACPELRTILTQELLANFTCLEYLIVDDCAKIKSLVNIEEDITSASTHFLPNLKKISLLHLPELVSISSGIRIAPRLESLVVYDCLNLEKLSNMEVSDNISEIKGENEWWDVLKWCEPEWTSGRPDYLASVFISLGTDGDIMDELADAVNFLPELGD